MAIWGYATLDLIWNAFSEYHLEHSIDVNLLLGKKVWNLLISSLHGASDPSFYNKLKASISAWQLDQCIDMITGACSLFARIFPMSNM